MKLRRRRGYRHGSPVLWANAATVEEAGAHRGVVEGLVQVGEVAQARGDAERVPTPTCNAGVGGDGDGGRHGDETMMGVSGLPMNRERRH
jgi:hypothetical protein